MNIPKISQKTTAILTIIAIILGCWSVVSTKASADQLPDLGNEFRSFMSVHDEKLIGDHFMREIRASGLLHQDPVVNEYVRYLGNRLTPYMPVPYANLQPKFFAVNDKTVNAFAFFGAHVGVHSGIIALTQSENELAGVMAHELGHVSQQHLVRQLAEQKRTMPLATLGAVAGSVLGGPELGLAVLSAGMQRMLNFSRQHEQEADRVGIQILSKAKFDPQGLPNIFERMNTNARYDGKMPEYLATHPMFESRISDVRHRASKMPYVRKADSQMYHIVKARVAVQNANNAQQLVYDAEQQLKSARYANEIAAKYKYAYALHKAGKNKEALAAVKNVLAIAKDNMLVQMLAAEIEADNSKYKDAQIRLEDQLALHDDSPALKLQYIELLLLTSQAPQALRTLDQYHRQHACDLQYYEYCRQAAGMLNNKAAVYEANAEWYLLVGAYDQAILQLTTALEQSNLATATKDKIEQRRSEIKSLKRTLEKL